MDELKKSEDRLKAQTEDPVCVELVVMACHNRYYLDAGDS